MAGEPERTGSRLLDVAVTLLLAAMAVWGAVAIIRSVWVWLCVGAGIAVVVGAVVWLVRWRWSRW